MEKTVKLKLSYVGEKLSGVFDVPLCTVVPTPARDPDMSQSYLLKMAIFNKWL